LIPANATVADAARAYLEQCISVIPLHRPTRVLAPKEEGGCTCGRPDCTDQGKHNAVASWRAYQARRATPEELSLWFPPEGEPRNLGIVTGEVSCGLTVIDCDDPDTHAALCFAYPDLRKSLTVQTGKGFHVYAFAPEKLASTTFTLNGKEHHVSAEGRMVVAPPSLHASGRTYAFLDPEAVPVVLDLERLRTALRRLGAKRPDPEQGARKESGWAARYLDEGATVGQRDTRTFELANYLRHHLPEDVTESILTMWAETRCDQPWGRNDVNRKIRAARRYGEYQPT